VFLTVKVDTENGAAKLSTQIAIHSISSGLKIFIAFDLFINFNYSSY
jgi:hypothetical protein